MSPSSAALGSVHNATQVPRGARNGWRAALIVYAGAFYAFLYGPIAIVLVLSFNKSEVTGLPFLGATSHWYRVVFARRDLMAALFNSISLGLLAFVRKSGPAVKHDLNRVYALFRELCERR